MNAKYEGCISHNSRVIVEVKADNRQTGQTKGKPDIQDENDIHHIIFSVVIVWLLFLLPWFRSLILRFVNYIHVYKSYDKKCLNC